MNRHRLLAVAAIALGLAPVSAVHADDTLTVVQVNSVSAAATKVPTTESKSYNLLSGNPRWATGPTVYLPGPPHP